MQPSGHKIGEHPNCVALILLLDYYINSDKAGVAKIRHRDEWDHFPARFACSGAKPFTLTGSAQSTIFRRRKLSGFQAIGFGQDDRLLKGLFDSDGLTFHFTSEVH